MSLRIAYDITRLSELYTLRDYKIGVSRTIEGLLLELLKITEIDLKIVNTGGQSPPLTIVSGNLYAKNVHGSSFTIDNNFNSKFIPKIVYQSLFTAYCHLHRLKSDHNQPALIKAFWKFWRENMIVSQDTFYTFNPANYDLIHITSIRSPLKELTGTLPRLITIYDLFQIQSNQYKNTSRENFFQNFINNIDLQKDWITCISEYTRQEFLEYTGMSTDRVFTNLQGANEQFYPVIDTEMIQLTRQHYSIPDGDYFLCVASYLDPRKNVPFLIQNFIKLITEQPNLDINLVIVGSLSYKSPELITLIEELKEYKNRVNFTGFVPDQDLRVLYSGATAFVFPSLREGFGIPVLEAMQCGTPVITSNVTSLPEIAGDAAILINPLDSDELCQAMLNLLSNNDLRDRLKQKGIERAKQFSWSKCARETLEIYKRMVN
jgi:glycosyltransferase involved in cell wall biosynthesis